MIALLQFSRLSTSADAGKIDDPGEIPLCQFSIPGRISQSLNAADAVYLRGNRAPTPLMPRQGVES